MTTTTGLCVYVLVGDQPQSAVSGVVALCRQCAAAGHHVILLTDRTSELPTAVDGICVQSLPPGREDHRYFSEDQRSADLVRDALMALGRAERASVLFFVGCASAALSVIRGRRLLGEFRRAAVVLVDEDAMPPDLVSVPGTLFGVYQRWAAEYVRRRADATVSYRGRPNSLTTGLLPHPVVEPPVSPAPAPAPRISVVIPLFNQGNYVQQAVASALDQRVPDLEVVVVDDGSTDPATVATFDNLRGVTKVRQHNRGLSAARNAGIAQAQGQYIVPLDADDVLAPGFIPKAVRALEGNPDLGYVVGHARYTGLLNHVYVPAGLIPEVALFLHTHGKSVGLFRKDALSAVGGYDESFPAFEDWEIQIALYRAGFETDVLPIEAQIYRRHPKSMSFTMSNHMRPELLELMIRKHVKMLRPDQIEPALLLLARFWKTGYEPSASVLFQASQGIAAL